MATGPDWDLHAGGVPNLTRAIEKKWLRELTWQTIDLKVATVEDLLEAPVLFLSGQQSLELTREQQRESCGRMSNKEVSSLPKRVTDRAATERL